jgi:hypothetical protein
MKNRRDDIHTTPDVTYIHNPAVAHESSDVNIKSVLLFTLALLVGGIFVSVLMWGMLKILEDRSVKQDQKSPPGPMALTEKERLPVEPRLQSAPGFGDDLDLGKGKNLELQAPDAEYKILSARWKEILEHGKTDTATGAVTAIPIEKAKRQLLEKGLPVRPVAQGQKTYEQAMEVPAYSSAGRTMEMRRQ